MFFIHLIIIFCVGLICNFVSISLSLFVILCVFFSRFFVFVYIRLIIQWYWIQSMSHVKFNDVEIWWKMSTLFSFKLYISIYLLPSISIILSSGLTRHEFLSWYGYFVHVFWLVFSTWKWSISPSIFMYTFYLFNLCETVITRH